MSTDRGHVYGKFDPTYSEDWIAAYCERLIFKGHPSSIDGLRPIVKAYRVDDSGRFQFPKYADHGIKVNSKKKAASGAMTFVGKLREGQVAGVAGALKVITREGGCTAVADPGSGKTVLALCLLSHLKRSTALILVDQINLVEQWIERIQQFLPEVAIEVMSAEVTVRRLRKKYDLSGTEGTITIATAQSLYRNESISWLRPRMYGVLICDEAHAFSAPSFVDAITKVNFQYSLALTATPDRRDGLEHVFMAYIGTEHVVFKGEIMDPVVHVTPAPNAGLDAKDWMTGYCRLYHKQTTQALCNACDRSVAIPDCGGDLPWSVVKQEVIWSKKLDFGGLVSAWCLSDEMVDWAHAVIKKLMAKNRKIFYFATNINILLLLYREAVRLYPNRVGLYVGTSSCPKELRPQLEDAVHKDLTFASYRKAAKGLDVPEKDALVLGSPVGDIRQIAGRIGRTKKGKKTPIIVLPSVDIGPFMGMKRKLEKGFREKKWVVK